MSLVLFNINLVAEHYKGKVLRILGVGLDQKLVSPAVQSFEGLCAVDVVDEHAAVGTTVKGDSE